MMTEAERNELIEAMAKAAWESDGVVSWEREGEFCRKIYLREARAALAVAEPAIREQADDALREENARLREALKGVIRIADRNTIEFDIARVAIREGGKG